MIMPINIGLFRGVASNVLQLYVVEITFLLWVKAEKDNLKSHVINKMFIQNR